MARDNGIPYERLDGQEGNTQEQAGVGRVLDRVPISEVSLKSLESIHQRATACDWYCDGSAVRGEDGVFYWRLADSGEDHNAQAIAMYHNNFGRLVATTRDLQSRLAQERARADRASALAVVLNEALEKVRPQHKVVEEDCWYSCPKSGECCRDEGYADQPECDCGADYVNAQIDAVLARADEQGSAVEGAELSRPALPHPLGECSQDGGELCEDCRVWVDAEAARYAGEDVEEEAQGG